MRWEAQNEEFRGVIELWKGIWHATIYKQNAIELQRRFSSKAAAEAHLENAYNLTQFKGIVGTDQEIGKVYGKLKILERVSNEKSRHKRYRCLCECGNLSEPLLGSLKNGSTKSCGCLRGNNKGKKYKVIKKVKTKKIKFKEKKIKVTLMSGEQLRELRKKLQKTQTEMGELLGITKQYVSLLELGKSRINEKVYNQILKLDSKET
nr:helix-turn-helix transcriptional regulator [Mycobacterium sp. E3298]